MANTFAELRKSRSKDLEKLTEQVNKLNDKSSEKKSYEDTRFWKPTVDKAGNGMAVIRFLPAAEGEDMPWVQLFSHSFQGPTGQWYIENSLTTLNKKDPVSEHNTMLWNSGVESDKETARKQKRKLQYIANVYIVKDPSNPDNDGKVFLFKGYQNYDKSEFDSPAALSEDDDELERIWKAQNKLSEFITEGNFKSYDELKARLNKVLNLEDDVVTEKPSTPVTKKAEKPAEVKKAKTVEDSPPWNDEDGDLSYFEKLAED